MLFRWLTRQIGQTTIVEKMYDDESVKGDFDRHVWMIVSYNYKNYVKHLMVNLIKKLVGAIKESPPLGLENMSIGDMKMFICKFARKKIFIVVLDDV